jgi:SAM-dependent methyltransferase
MLLTVFSGSPGTVISNAHAVGPLLKPIKPIKSSQLVADKINLGSGNDPLPGYTNVDMLNRDDVDVVHNLMDFPYPFEDNCATSIKAIDVIEHLDNYTDDKRPTIMAFIEECARILKPGGELYIQAPSWDSEIFKIDPTHVRGFHIKTFDFFDPDTEYGKIRDFYGGPKFKVRAEELENKNLRFWMVKR